MSCTTKFYTADTHFGHELMLAGSACARPFNSVQEMDEALIGNWNSVVKPTDIVYHLGDIALGLNNPDRVRGIFSRLHGRKHLVYGNHDIRRDGDLHPTILGLDWAARPEALVFVQDEGQKIVLSHYAQRAWQGHRKGVRRRII